MNLESDDAVYCIALNRIPRVGPVIARNLVSYCGSPKAVFEEPRHRLMRIPGVGERIAGYLNDPRLIAEARAELVVLMEQGIDVHFYLDESYPHRLKQITQAPVVLYTRGTAGLNAHRAIAVVGTRKPSHHGRAICQSIVEGLAAYRPTIVSGLAYGIDIVAHKTALAQGLDTIGVMGSGFGEIYPASHRQIAHQMLSQGALISEFSFYTKPDKDNFPARNRIIAAMSDLVLVVESAASGGSVITAEFANNFNREVVAVPGRPSDPVSAGCNLLIKRQKAALVETGNDIARILRWDIEKSKTHGQQKLFADLSDDERLVIELLLPGEPVQLDTVARRSKLSSSLLAAVLLSLEFKGLVRALPGKRYMTVS